MHTLVRIRAAWLLVVSMAALGCAGAGTVSPTAPVLECGRSNAPWGLGYEVGAAMDRIVMEGTWNEFVQGVTVEDDTMRVLATVERLGGKWNAIAVQIVGSVRGVADTAKMEFLAERGQSCRWEYDDWQDTGLVFVFRRLEL